MHNLKMILRHCLGALLLVTAAIHADPEPEYTFMDDLKVVDDALRNNPTHALRQSLESCLKQRNHAVVLNEIGMEERARRALQYCFDSLYLTRETVVKVKAPTQEELQALAGTVFLHGPRPTRFGPT